MSKSLLGIVVVSLVVAGSAVSAPAQPVDCDAARCVVRAAVDAECPCEEARNHGRYLACVARVVNRAAREGTMPKACRNKVNGCFIRSLCGKRERTVLCDLPGDGPSGRCRPLLSAEHCEARGGEVVSTCCPSCDATTPTPTPSVPAPTTTPAASGGTATTVATPSAAGASATPSQAAATPTAEATPLPTATPAATATAAPTATVGATPTEAASTPTAVATATTAATGTTATTPLATATPAAGATPLVFPLSVDIEGEPDEGPAPLTVQWTSEVEDGTRPYSYRWSFGDGTPDVEGAANPTHIYERSGDFTATLTVRDAQGQEETADFDVTVTTP